MEYLFRASYDWGVDTIRSDWVRYHKGGHHPGLEPAPKYVREAVEDLVARVAELAARRGVAAPADVATAYTPEKRTRP